jgi:2-dehydropantoate 2-reductase
MGKHIVFIGAGAVGGMSARISRALGEDVALVDAWPEHIEAIKRDGMHLGGSQGEHVVKVKAMHMSDVQSFVRKPVDICDHLHEIVRHRMGGADDQAVT